MKAITPGNPLSYGLATVDNGKQIKRKTSSFLHGCSLGTPKHTPFNKSRISATKALVHPLLLNGRRHFCKYSCLAVDHSKILFSPAIACISCSDFSLGSCNVCRRINPTCHSLKEDIGESVGIPDNIQTVKSELMIMALPAIVGQAIEPLAQLMETAIIGRLGPVQLASVGVSISIFNIVSKLFNFPLLSITTSFVAEDISRAAGRESVTGDKISGVNNESQWPVGKIAERARLPSISTALILAAGIGAVEAIALSLGAGLFLNIMGIPWDSPMRSSAQQFLSLRALGAPAVVVSLAIQGVFRGFKDTKTPLYCTGLGTLSAIILLPILVHSFHLGITGAAIAIVASQYFITFSLIFCLNKRAIILPPKLEDLQFGGYIKSGGLLLGRTLAVLITMTLGTSMAARQGPFSMAAHQICLQVWLAVSLLSDALALSAQALIASSFSLGDYRRVKDITYCVLKTGLLTGVSSAIILCVSFSSLAELFTKDVEVLRIARSGILFVSASQPINALAFIFDGLHYGVSDFSYSACSMMTVGAISSAFLLFVPRAFGLSGVWSGLTLFMSLRMAAGFLRLVSKNGPWWFLKDSQRTAIGARNTRT